MRSLSWVLAVWLWIGMAGCTRTHSEVGDSSTHWLRRCGSDDQCGGLSCLCGVCSSECSASTECAGLSAAAVCAQATATECGASGSATPRVCDRTCQRDQDCGGGLRCVDERCRYPQEAVTDASEQAPAADGGSAAILDAQPAVNDAGSSGARDGATSDAETALNTLTFLCAPQRARSNGDDCVQSAGYAWNGAACEPIVCGCEGEDCAAVSSTLGACEAAFASCQPTSMCSGLPWYRCNDYCPAHWVLQGGGRLFGSCQGDCRFELVFNPSIVLDVGGCMRLDADLSVFNTDGTQRSVHMQLTDAAWKQAALLSLALEGASIEPVTGCPDCVDQGEAWFSRLAGGAEIEKFRYGFRQPAEGVRALDSFIQRLIDQGKECRGDLLVSCGSYSVEPTPRCGTGLPVSSTSCDCSVPFEQLNSLKGTACNEGCGSCQVPNSTCGATCIQPCAGGEPVWEPYCTE